MSFSDRRYDDEPRGGFMGGDRPSATLWIVGANVLVMVVVWIVGGGIRGGGTGELFDRFALKSDAPLELWRWITYGFLHADVMHLFWNMLMVFFVGRMLEPWLGRRRLAWTYVGLVAFAGIGFYAQMLLQGEHGRTIGASGAALGLIVLFGTSFPRREILLFGMLPMHAWVLAAVLVGIDLLSVLAHWGAEPTARGVHLAGAAGGFAIGFLGPRLSVWREAHAVRRREARREAVKRSEEEERVELDRILAKIRQESLDGLTAREREFLRAQSQKLKGMKKQR